MILNFKGLSDTIECLESLRRQTYSNCQLVVVENGSEDSSAALLRAEFPEIELIEFEQNRGWAAGNNAGIELGLGRQIDFFCLLNNDTVLMPDTIERLVRASEETGPCLMHPAIYFYDEPDSAQLDPASGSWARAIAGHASLFKLNFAYGACLMIHNTVFRSLGLFDERFFLQLEETDFYKRAEKADIPSVCLANCRILHKVSRSFGGRQTPVKTYYATRNRLLLAEKYERSPREILIALKQLYWSALDVAKLQGKSRNDRLKLISWLFSRDTFAHAIRRGITDYFLRRFGRMSGSLTGPVSR